MPWENVSCDSSQLEICIIRINMGHWVDIEGHKDWQNFSVVQTLMVNTIEVEVILVNWYRVADIPICTRCPPNTSCEGKSFCDWIQIKFLKICQISSSRVINILSSSDTRRNSYKYVFRVWDIESSWVVDTTWELYVPRMVMDNCQIVFIHHHNNSIAQRISWLEYHSTSNKELISIEFHVSWPYPVTCRSSSVAVVLDNRKVWVRADIETLNIKNIVASVVGYSRSRGWDYSLIKMNDCTFICPASVLLKT